MSIRRPILPPISALCALEALDRLRMLIGMQGSPTFSAHFGPTAGRKGSWGGPPGQPDLLDANRPCWPFRHCLMIRSCSMKRISKTNEGGSNLIAESPSLWDFVACFSTLRRSSDATSWT